MKRSSVSTAPVAAAALLSALMPAMSHPAHAQGVNPPSLPSPAIPLRPADPDQDKERTSFQTGSPWDPMLDTRADVAMVYGVGPGNIARIPAWRDAGYRVHTMTGVAWGNYQDYLYGRFDGVNHEDEAQTDKNGHKIGHGGDVYYMSPGINYGKYLCVGVKRALDAGVKAIHLEEPEFWVRAGWSGGFQREWKDYYHENWIAPDSSPDAQYRASLLKYYLYRRALSQIFDFVRAYNKEHKTDVKCYVATHSLINYASWQIVSPESSLAKVGADGFIAQVWTGTARTNNVYEGRTRSRTFETAFLEYGALSNVAWATKTRLWFLNDPVEDDPDHSWRDYRTNWESTLTASLLWPDTSRYEIMPWPERIFHGTYPTKDRSERMPGEPVAKEPIPPDYATELMTVTQALNDMDQKRVKWECGTRGLGVLVSDSMLFQRYPGMSSDPHLGSFFGLALPLLKRGIPVEPVQLENATLPHALDRYKVLLLTWEGMKPMAPEDTQTVADWVRRGGVLVYVDDDKDPYNAVRAWWNTAPNHYPTPRAAFFAQLGLPADAAPGNLRVGKGTVLYDIASPAALTYQADGGDHIRALARNACAAAHLDYQETTDITLRRGPYVIAAGLDEQPAGDAAAARTLTGTFIDLFDANLPVVHSVALAPGSRHLLLDLDALKPKAPSVLAGASKVLGATVLPHGGGFRFHVEGPDKTNCAVRLRLDAAPSAVLLDDTLPLAADAQVWDADSKTLLLRFPNAATGHWVTVRR